MTTSAVSLRTGNEAVRDVNTGSFCLLVPTMNSKVRILPSRNTLGISPRWRVPVGLGRLCTSKDQNHGIPRVPVMLYGSQNIIRREKDPEKGASPADSLSQTGDVSLT